MISFIFYICFLKSSWQSNLIMIIYILSIRKCVAGQWYRNRRSRMCKRINKSQESIWFSSRQRWKINIWKYIEWRVWSWLRMNADRMLNTCKSLANLCLHRLAKADGWVTRKELALQTGITDGNDWQHLIQLPARMCPAMKRDAAGELCVLLACWWGNGSPRRW